MLTQADIEARLVAQLQDPGIITRYQVGDPLVVQQLKSIAAFMMLIGQEIDVATVEPFIKTRDRSIISDASNKGILPIATPCQYTLEVINKAASPVTLSQGRLIEDHAGGRPWRLLQSITVEAGGTGEVLVEQSEYREVTYTVPLTEPFHRVKLDITDDLSLAGITVRNDNQNYTLTRRWMNAAPLDYAFNLSADSLRRIFIEFGDNDKAGRTVGAGQQFTFGLLETYGNVDISRLKDASLLEVYNSDEQRVSVRFKAAGVVREGANPLSVSQLRVLASYPALYDENAVFLGNFDYSVRQKFMARVHYLAVWNENEQERYYGASFADINYLHLCVVAKNSGEQATLEQEIAQYIGQLDSLYKGRVRVHAVVQKPFNVTVTGRLAAVHDLQAVTSQIKGLLVDKYGKNKLSSSRWLVNGFNTQEVISQIRKNITAFQDNISDFGLSVPVEVNKPHEWVFVATASVTVNLSRTAEIGAAWIL